MSEAEKQREHQRKAKSNFWLGILGGFVAGVIVCGAGMFALMPSLMIVTKESSLGYDDTVASLEQNIEENGWVVSRVMDMNKSMAKHGVEFEPRVTLVKLCKAEYAKSVLTTDRHISTMMPCTISVWEGDDGKVYLSKMNLGLMAKMFGGNVAKVMGGDVVRDEAKILRSIVQGH